MFDRFQSLWQGCAMFFPREVTPSWHRYFDDLALSSPDFYKAIEDALATRQIPGIRVRYVTFFERGLLSAKRLYLQIERDWMIYRICAAPFGTGYFFSSRLFLNVFRTWPIIVGIVILSPAVPCLLFLLLLHQTANLLWTAAITGAASGLLLMFLASVVGIWIYMCRHLTYHRQDTMKAFQDAMERLFQATVESTIQPKGHRPLPVEEIRPIHEKLVGA
jgi:hypothetical protein